jgi:hypothetical protein
VESRRLKFVLGREFSALLRSGITAVVEAVALPRDPRLHPLDLIVELLARATSITLSVTQSEPPCEMPYARYLPSFESENALRPKCRRRELVWIEKASGVAVHAFLNVVDALVLQAVVLGEEVSVRHDGTAPRCADS